MRRLPIGSWAAFSFAFLDFQQAGIVLTVREKILHLIKKNSERNDGGKAK